MLAKIIVVAATCATAPPIYTQTHTQNIHVIAVCVAVDNNQQTSPAYNCELAERMWNRAYQCFPKSFPCYRLLFLLLGLIVAITLFGRWLWLSVVRCWCYLKNCVVVLIIALMSFLFWPTPLRAVAVNCSVVQTAITAICEDRAIDRSVGHTHSTSQPPVYRNYIHPTKQRNS